MTRVERTDTPNGQVLLLYGTLRKVRDRKLLGVDAEGVTADGRINLALKFRMSPTTTARAARWARASGGRGVWRFRWRRA